MSTYPSDLKYSKDHEWVHVEGTQATMSHLGLFSYQKNPLSQFLND